MNNTFTIKISSPLLRPGLTIETEVSEKYLVRATTWLLGAVREINDDRTMSQRVADAIQSDLKSGGQTKDAVSLLRNQQTRGPDNDRRNLERDSAWKGPQ
jgi:hypothetical protein